ncbi:MAG TPA: hypothetical protein VN176_03640 [Verrucomicrobiae bacterium]|jgi:hypothetical protein|nr:hypothetical protein [Verrucomicrobiae bacterium]
MSSPGTGADITRQDANDILHKWVTESVKVQAAFVSGAKVNVFIIGLIRTVPDGRLAVVERDEVGGPAILFDPSLASGIKYGDNRAFSSTPRDLLAHGAPDMVAALVFTLVDGSQIALFEIAETP